MPTTRSRDLETVHGTAVAVPTAEGAAAPRGVLLRGPSGSGKSDLALRLIDRGDMRLVADDRVRLVPEGDALVLRAPAAIAGRLEVRGLGIVPVAALDAAPLALVVDLVARAAVPRLPARRTVHLAGYDIPALALHAFDISTPAKIAAALDLLATPGAGDPETGPHAFTRADSGRPESAA